MDQKKYANLDSLVDLVANIKARFAEISHKHTKSDITDFPDIPSKISELTNDVGFKTTDSSLSDTSTNPVQNNVIKAEFDTVNESIDSIKDAKADWNQNDETAIDYIKNRPFYTGDLVETTLVDNVDVTIEKEEDISPPFYIGLVEGSTYKVILNGTEYECVANKKMSSETESFLYLGNLDAISIFVSGSTDSCNPPFAYVEYPDKVPFFIPVPLSEPHQLTVIGTSANIVKAPYKYMPYISNNTKNGEAFNGDGNNKALGHYSHAEGCDTYANGHFSHAEGSGTYANGGYSHAEGCDTYANGSYSHAEGGSTYANGSYSHAEGSNTKANGMYSHVEGDTTKASSDYQHVQGKYNIEDADNKYAHIVGNGKGYGNHTRSNAHTLDWSGNAWYAGNVFIGGTGQDDTNAKKLATEEYVQNSLSTAVPSMSTLTFTGAVVGTYDGSEALTVNIPEIVTDSELSTTSTNPVQNSVIKAELNAVNEAIDAIKDAKADWNQNDEAAADYIKNRTHYTEDGMVETVLVEEQEFAFSDGVTIIENVNTGLNTTLIFKYDGVEYTTVTSEYVTGGMTAYAFGISFSSDGSPIIDESLPFYGLCAEQAGQYVVQIVSKTSETSHTIGITKIENSEIVHQLNEKYIPDTIARTKDIANSLSNSLVLTSFIMVDEVTGYEYVVKMSDGKIVYVSLYTGIVVEQINSAVYITGEDFYIDKYISVFVSCANGTTREITDYTYNVDMSTIDSGYVRAEITYTGMGNTFTTAIDIEVETIDLQDFNYTSNGDGTYTLTSWKGTLNGATSTEIVLPDNPSIIL